jgi:hypothetical protein
MSTGADGVQCRGLKPPSHIAARVLQSESSTANPFTPRMVQRDLYDKAATAFGTAAFLGVVKELWRDVPPVQFAVEMNGGNHAMLAGLMQQPQQLHAGLQNCVTVLEGLTMPLIWQQQFALENNSGAEAAITDIPPTPMFF